MSSAVLELISTAWSKSTVNHYALGDVLVLWKPSLISNYNILHELPYKDQIRIFTILMRDHITLRVNKRDIYWSESQWTSVLLSQWYLFGNSISIEILLLSLVQITGGNKECMSVCLSVWLVIIVLDYN